MNEKDILREHGLKVTNARIELYRFLSSTSYPLSAEELYRNLAPHGLDLSTVYRSLNSFVEAGLAKKEVGPHKENLYLLLRDEECHVLVCLRCGKRVPLHGCPFHEANEAIEEETGFHVLDHNTEIYGICPDCRKKEGRIH